MPSTDDQTTQLGDPAAQVAEIRAILAAFDWESGDRQLALEAIERIVTEEEVKAMPKKLFIWEGVLTDYSSGMIVVLAPDLEMALASADSDSDYMRADMGRVTPTVVDLTGEIEPQVWYVHGGG